MTDCTAATLRLLAAAYAGLVILALAPAVPGLLPVVCGAVLLALGDLWLRALTGETVAPATRIGLAAMAGLVTLPLAAVALHVVGVPIRARALAAALAVLATGLGAVALVRARAFPADHAPRQLHLARPAVAVAVAGVLTAAVAVPAVLAYVRLQHPPLPGYTSLALGGWAAGIDRPVAIPARGLRVPIRISRAGDPSGTVPLRVRVGDRTVNARSVPVEAGATRSVEVYVPAPPGGCLHRIEISMGAASTVFYAHGPAGC